MDKQDGQDKRRRWRQLGIRNEELGMGARVTTDFADKKTEGGLSSPPNKANGEPSKCQDRALREILEKIGV